MTTGATYRIAPRDEAWYTTVLAEWCGWEVAHLNTRARPDEPGGLPTGWHVVSCLPVTWTSRILYLVTRPGGGWMVVSHHRDFALTCLHTSHQSLLALHQRLDRDSKGPFAIAAPSIGAVLISLYDPTDDREAAARTMALLGASLYVEPARATAYLDSVADSHSPVGAY